MASLPVCLLPPDQDTYAYTPNASFISTQLDGGASRFRADQLGAAIVFTIQWTLSAFNYAYLMAFYRTAINYGSLPFLIDLILDDGTMRQYTVHMLPATFNMVSQAGQSYVMGCTLEVLPNTAYAANDAAIIAAGVQGSSE
jgi:hypothetical protein